MKNLIENQKMNRKNIELYNRIIRSLDGILNEALSEDSKQNEMIKVVAICCNSLGGDNLDLMHFGNDISLLFRLSEDNQLGKLGGYYYVGPNWNACKGNELWRRLDNLNNVIGNVEWNYEGVYKLKSYPQPGTVVTAFDMSNNMYHHIRINSAEIPLETIENLFYDKKLSVRRIKGYSTQGVKEFINYLVEHGLLDDGPLYT